MAWTQFAAHISMRVTGVRTTFCSSEARQKMDDFGRTPFYTQELIKFNRLLFFFLARSDGTFSYQVGCDPSMTSLLEHSDAKPIEYRFFLKIWL